MVKQVIVVRKDLNMRKGKIAAQVAHASLGVFFDRMYQVADTGDGSKIYSVRMDPDMAEWKENAFTKVVVSVDSEQELIEIYGQALIAKLPCKLITDAGKTEFHGIATHTCLAIGPADAEKIDKITGNLKLM